MSDRTRQRLSLAGQWDWAFDEGNDGLRRGWMAGHWPGESEGITVPALWTVTHPDKNGVAFYRKRFALPDGWAGQALRLRIGGASYRLDAWLNGAYIGSHEGAYTPFAFDVAQAAHAGAENELVLRIAGLAKDRAVDGLVLQQCPASKQSWYFTEAGLWGEVYLEALPPLWCEAAAIEPDLDKRCITVEVETHNAYVQPAQAGLRLLVTAPDGRPAAELSSVLTLPSGATCQRYRIALDRAVAWTCENPALYRLQATLTGDRPDSLDTTFGMRDFTVEDGRFFLNGEPVFLRGILLQPNYPVNLITPPTPEMMRDEIRLAKEAGFNLMRTHIRPSPPGYLDLADQMGMMIYAESCLAWIKDSPRLLDHGRRELEAMISRDRNHPSVVIWGVLNENRQAAAIVAGDLTRYVRGLDPTRVVIDDSGGTLAIDQDFGWVDRATAIANRDTERRKIMDIHIYCGAPAPAPVHEWMRTLGVGEQRIDMPGLGIGLPAVLDEFYRELRGYAGGIYFSEIGCGGMSDLRDTVARFGAHDGVDAHELRLFSESLQNGFKQRGLERVFGSLDGLLAASQEQQAVGNTRQIEAIMANPRASGYCLTQLNDLSWEFHAGILDVWRRPKRAYEAVKRVNRPRCLILTAGRWATACNVEVPLAVTLVDSMPVTDASTVEIVVASAAGAQQASFRLSAPPGAGIKELGTIAVKMGDRPGWLRVTARLDDRSRNPAVESTETILVLEQVDAAAAGRQVRWLDEPADASALAGDAGGQLLGVRQPGALSGQAWEELLSAVAAGNVAIIGPLQTGDQTALAAFANHGLRLQVRMGIGSWMGCYHWIADSPLFAGLPAGGLAGEAYTSVIPRYVLSEQGGEVLAGSLYNTNSRFESPAILWFSDVEAVPHGKGMLLFCQYRLFDQPASDPLAARLLANLVKVAQDYQAGMH